MKHEETIKKILKLLENKRYIVMKDFTHEAASLGDDWLEFPRFLLEKLGFNYSKKIVKVTDILCKSNYGDFVFEYSERGSACFYNVNSFPQGYMWNEIINLSNKSVEPIEITDDFI